MKLFFALRVVILGLSDGAEQRQKQQNQLLGFHSKEGNE